jgi:glucose 1-dehydrogenase
MRVLVTGTSPGIGGATCRRLARQAKAAGSAIQIAACEIRDTPEQQALVRELEAEGAELLSLTGDLADPEVPVRLVEAAAQAFGGLDVLVANAGITAPAPLSELALADWDRVMNVNLRATWLLAKAGYPHLKAAGGGAVVAVASMSGMKPHPGMGAYSPSKAGIIILCQTLAQEWAADRIRVNAISPGMIRTPLSAAVYADNRTAEARANLVPLGRVGEAEDIADVIAFLLGPEARYLTGQNLCVDGGFADSIMRHVPGRPRSRG